MAMFAERFEMNKLLGRGGMAEVWLAKQQGMSGFSRQVVIKKMSKGLANDLEFVRRFEDEARIAALINHPNVVRVEDFGEEHGIPYLVMEYIDGHDLETVSEWAHGLNQRLPMRLILQIGVDIANGLHEVHNQRDLQGQALHIVHRDVSPQNIMLDRSGRSRLLDFGVARAATNRVKTEVGILKGKIAYFSPEQSRGQDLDGRSDQFSLAVVLYELMTGHRLFLDRSDLATLRRVRQGFIPALNLHCDEASDDLLQVMTQALCRNHQGRFPDCGNLAVHLARSLDRLGGRVEGQELSELLATLRAAAPSPLPSIPLPRGNDEVTQISLTGLRAVSGDSKNDALTVVSQPGFLAEFADEDTETSKNAEVEYETLRDLPAIDDDEPNPLPVKRIHAPPGDYPGAAEVIEPMLSPEYTQNQHFGGPKFTILLLIAIGLVAGLLFTFL